MSDEYYASLLRQRDELRLSLSLNAERQALFASPTEIPLQLLRDERALRRKLSEIEQEIEEYSGGIPAVKNSSGKEQAAQQRATAEAQRPKKATQQRATAEAQRHEEAAQQRAGELGGCLVLILLMSLILSGKNSDSSVAFIPPPEKPILSTVEIAPGIPMDLVEVPAGIFLMGSPDDDPDANDDEKPQHELHLDTFAIGKTEVTNAQFRPFVEGDGYTNPDYWTAGGWAWRNQQNRTTPIFWDSPKWNVTTQPVVGVTWYEAMAYAAWLSAQTGGDYRLPSEAEWEKAACGTDDRRYPWGDEPPNESLANFGNIITGTISVGSFPAGASPYGGLDMSGNVWEWTRSVFCNDIKACYKTRLNYPYNRRDGRESSSNVNQKSFTLRGGSSLSNNAQIRCGARGGDRSVTWADPYIGFRVVCAPCLR